MNAPLSRPADLPVRRSLTSAYVSSCTVGILALVASVAGLVLRSAVYPTDALARAFVPNDVANLLIGLPLLVGSTLLAWRGRLAGLLAWPGALLYVLYTYAAYAIAVPVGPATVVYAALLVSSAYALIHVVTSIDGRSVKTSLGNQVSERLTGGILAGLGALFLVRSGSVIADAAVGGAAVAPTDLAVGIADFLVSPVWVIGGVLLWRRQALGYVLGLGLLVGLSLLFVALVALMLVQPMLSAAPLLLVDVAVVLVMGLICFVPCGLFARGVRRATSPV